MKSLLIAAVAIAATALTGAAQASEALAKDKGCLACHAVDKKKMGPGFKDIAAANKGKADAEATIVAKLKSGKGHPTVKAGEDDLKVLTKWILSL